MTTSISSGRQRAAPGQNHEVYPADGAAREGWPVELTPATTRTLCYAIVALGLIFRLLFYLGGGSIWGDEAAVINNLDKSYLQLLGPLKYFQAAPPIFLWITKMMGAAFGDHPLVWRAVPFLASCGALLLMVPVARRALPGWLALIALLLFAFSDKIALHSSEAKPYTIDLLCAVFVLALYCRIEGWPLFRQMLLYAAVSPLLIWSSYRAIFMLAGLFCVMLRRVANVPAPGDLIAFLAMISVAAAAFLLLWFGPIRAQDVGPMRWYWKMYFPDYGRLTSVVAWPFSRTFEAFRYGISPDGGLLIPIAMIGGISLWKSRQREIVLMLVLPMLAGLTAGLLGRYVWGHSRTDLYAVPAMILLTAAGLGPIGQWSRQLNGVARWSLAVGVAILFLLPVGESFYHLRKPWWWRAEQAREASAYVITRLQPGDTIAGNHWEFDYYLGRANWPYHFNVELNARAAGARFWILTSGKTPYELDTPAARLQARGWKISARKEFAFARVFLLERAAPHRGAAP